MNDLTQELEAAVASLEEIARSKKGRRVDRYDARALLVPLGLLLLERGSEAVADHVERIQAAAERLGEPWAEAIQGELSLAATEHVHAVDPRYLTLPNYDFAYTLEARRRLEARLVAAEELDVELPAALADGVRRADERLAPYLDPGSDRGPDTK